MRTIGLLGGTGWPSTMAYYRLINEMVNASLGNYHSANIVLKSIDNHNIISKYGTQDKEICHFLKKQIQEILKSDIDCLIICCNALHKYYDLISNEINLKIPIFHAIELIDSFVEKNRYRNVLLLATLFTIKDGFFTRKLEERGVNIITPTDEESAQLKVIHAQLLQNNVLSEAKEDFKKIRTKYQSVDAVLLGCTEFTLLDDNNVFLAPIIDPIHLQCMAAVAYSLN
jgi:aspartate racemase